MTNFNLTIKLTPESIELLRRWPTLAPVALRAMAKTSLAAAIAFDVGTAPGQSDWAFYEYDTALSSVITINRDAFTTAVAAGSSAATGWTWLIRWASTWTTRRWPT